MVGFPYYSHTTPIRIPKDMGMVWEWVPLTIKGVPLLGVPRISLELMVQKSGEHQLMRISHDLTRVLTTFQVVIARFLNHQQ